MEILQVVSIGIIASVLAIILKSQRPEYAIHISIIAGIIIFMFILSKLVIVMDMIQEMIQKVNIDYAFLSTIIKIIGIAYITEFGSQVCKDAGEGAIAAKIELGGKVTIMVLAVPIIMALLDVIIGILPK